LCGALELVNDPGDQFFLIVSLNSLPMDDRVVIHRSKETPSRLLDQCSGVTAQENTHFASSDPRVGRIHEYFCDPATHRTLAISSHAWEPATVSDAMVAGVFMVCLREHGERCLAPRGVVSF